MNFLAKENSGRRYQLAWWLCIITLPWIDMANNISIILLSLVWITEGNFGIKWQRLKSSTWVWPFLIYYSLLVIGVFYSQDFDNGLFTLDKKISFFILPVIISTGQPLNEKFAGLLKRSFVYSCFAVILLCLTVGAFYYFKGGPSANFDFNTNENFKSIHPDASPFWMHFSYIQLAHWAGLHPGYLSLYLVFCLIVLLTETYSNLTERNIHFLFGFLIAGFIGLLSSRMAIFSFIGCSFYMMASRIQEKKIKLILPVVLLSIFIVLIIWLNPVARFRIVEEPMNTTYQADQTITSWNSVSYRLLEWEGSWSVIRANWLTGIGTGGSKIAMDNFYAHYNHSTVGLEHNAHNQYLQTWMENGLFGLFAFIVCLLGGLFRLHKDSSYVCFILIFSLMCLTESIGERQKGIVFFTIFQVLFLGFEGRKE